MTLAVSQDFLKAKNFNNKSEVNTNDQVNAVSLQHGRKLKFKNPEFWKSPLKTCIMHTYSFLQIDFKWTIVCR